MPRLDHVVAVAFVAVSACAWPSFADPVGDAPVDFRASPSAVVGHWAPLPESDLPASQPASGGRVDTSDVVSPARAAGLGPVAAVPAPVVRQDSAPSPILLAFVAVVGLSGAGLLLYAWRREAAARRATSPRRRRRL